jgi:cobalt-precorrin 5A hydrolase / cobalt-factor III methyltransferase / precorrin-3B C17-methyltransferase
VSAPVFVALSAGGLATARRLSRVLGGEVHGLAGRADGANVTFEKTSAHLTALFEAGRPIVGLMAAGALVRMLAPQLADKTVEPPVLAVAEDGSAVVPLLGGHHGGNELACRIAEVLEVAAAITSAGDVRFALALDAPPSGWRIANPERAKAVTAALLAGEPVGLAVEAGDAGWLTAGGARFAEHGAFGVRLTARAVVPGANELVLHPATLALGLGGERGVEADELLALAAAVLAEAGLSPLSLACVASHELKADESALLAVAARYGVPARFFGAVALEAETPRLANPSEAVHRAVGSHGVAEAAALAAAGGGATLVVAKRKSARGTAALARATAIIEPDKVGRAAGRLSVVGIGPGDAAWRTAEAVAALRRAEVVVGYGRYLDLVADLIGGTARHDFPLGAEEERVRLALELAAAGREVALVSSGDAGIYAMAALVFELAASAAGESWRRLAIEVVPGVSALQAAAARAGAPLGHDFCAISLSDLLTPLEGIERRLEAAAVADFVIALYNPASGSRRRPLARALAILARHRDGATPVVLARNLGRAGEAVRITTLAELDPGAVDMLTLLLVGNSTSRIVVGAGGRRRVYTPRGYGERR